MSYRRLSTFLVVAWIGAANADPAADKKHAGELAQEGQQHYKRGEFEVSVALLKQAYALYPEPTLLYNLARSLEGVGDKRGAVDAYKQYLASAADIEDRGAIERRVTTLEAELAASNQKPEPVPPPEVVVEKPAPKPIPQPIVVPPEPHVSIAPIVVAALGAVALGTGGVFGYEASKNHDDAVKALTGTAASSYNTTAHRDALVGNIAMIGGGAMLAGGVIWALVSRSTRGDEQVAGLHAHISPTSVALEWTFF
jgi:tetratricopeptide (TPR) repeat protein